jgi:hypothetical protein
VEKGVDVLLFVSRHASSNRHHSVHRGDVATVLELATVIKEIGGNPTLMTIGDQPPESGRYTEYCLGGPSTNPRTAAYLRSTLIGVQVESWDTTGEELTFWVGDQDYRRRPGAEEYVLLARVRHPHSRRPIFVVMGQVARANLGAARFLAENYRGLRKKHGDRAEFCLVLRVREAGALGPGLTEVVADKTVEAFQAAQVPTPEPPVKTTDAP